MRFPTPLVPARLQRRYKRFLADCVLEDGGRVTAHCANPGSMMGLAVPGTRVWLEPTDSPARKLKFGWRLVDHENGHLTCVDTGVPNRLLRAAFAARTVPPLAPYTDMRPEQRYGTNSRIDFLLSGEGLANAYVEVKSVTLSRHGGLAEFPDAVTARGAKHLGELAHVARAGHRAILLYVVQRTDCDRVAVAADIDPAYAAALDAAREAGVEILAFGTSITPERIVLGSALATVS